MFVNSNSVLAQDSGIRLVSEGQVYHPARNTHVRENEGGEECYWTPHVGGHARLVYHSFRKNVSDDEVEVGAEQYMIHGSGEDNGFATLGP